MLDAINTIRARHGLPLVSYDNADDVAAAQLALYVLANKSAAYPPSTATGLCYTSNVYSLSTKSNLYLSGSLANSQTIPSSALIHDSLIDALDSSLADRRWILYPFFNKTTFGRVDGPISGNIYPFGEVLKVNDNTLTDVSSMANDFVAYPYGNYPASEVNDSWYLSFSAIANKSDPTKNGASYVSFANASIAMVDASSNPLTITNQAADYRGLGLPNSLRWMVAGLQTNVTYTVTISNVQVNGATHAPFQYSFTLQ